MYIIINDEDEIFKPVTYPGVRPDTYMVSNYGRVFSTLQSKILREYVDRGGYHIVYPRAISTKRLGIPVHRLVAWEFCGGYDDIHNQVNHLDSDRSHNYFKNLEWVSPAENTYHGFDHGNINRYGENNHTNKYPKSMIIDIRNMISRGMRDIEIMQFYGYNKTRDNISLRDLIYSIRHKRTWNNI